MRCDTDMSCTALSGEYQEKLGYYDVFSSRSTKTIWIGFKAIPYIVCCYGLHLLIPMTLHFLIAQMASLPVCLDLGMGAIPLQIIQLSYF